MRMRAVDALKALGFCSWGCTRMQANTMRPNIYAQLPHFAISLLIKTRYTTRFYLVTIRWILVS